MTREIGSEFWDVPISEKQNDVFPKSTQWFLSGRSALQAIIKELGEAKSVSLPSWCCESIIKPFFDAGLDIHFYPVYWQNGLIQEVCLNSDVLFIIDYFGFISPMPNLADYKGIVIRDVTHSLFSATYSDSDYYFGSLRKWCGIWTGGYAWTKNDHKLLIEDSDDFGYVPLREKAMHMKNSFIHGWGITDKRYLTVYEEAEKCLEKVGIVPAAERDMWVAQKIDVEKIKNKRRANAEVLRKEFSDWLVFPDLFTSETPMFVPILIPDGNRDNLRKYLMKNRIYCPIHWPVSKYHKLDEKTEYIYKNELSLVCDQRYTEEDMNRMVETIKMFMEE